LYSPFVESKIAVESTACFTRYRTLANIFFEEIKRINKPDRKAKVAGRLYYQWIIAEAGKKQSAGLRNKMRQKLQGTYKGEEIYLCE